jgi:hypothetical protein
MDAKGRLDELMRLPFSAIKELPESSSQDGTDEEGRKCQFVIWRENLGPDTCRVVVSQHREHGLGRSTLRSAYGFTINLSGGIELLNPADVEQLFL